MNQVGFHPLLLTWPCSELHILTPTAVSLQCLTLALVSATSSVFYFITNDSFVKYNTSCQQTSKVF